MDITDEQEKLSDPSSKSFKHVTYSSSDRVIPEMVITSSEGISEREANVSECTIVLVPPSNGHSTDINSKNTSAEFTNANSGLEDKSDIDLEDISVVVKDVISKCTESVSHSVRQRPLRMEVDKNALAQQQENVKDVSTKCSPPPPPPLPLPLPLPSPTTSIISTPLSSSITSSPSSTIATSPTAMQRPLVFEDVSKTEPVLETQKNIIESPTEINKELVSDRICQEIQIIPEVPVENPKASDECASPTKKEGLHGVKKFFGSILHHDTQQQPTVCVEQPESPTEPMSPNTPKSGKSSIKKFFQTTKSDTTKIEQSGTKESESLPKPSKKFFDAFKHDTVESKESAKKNLNTDFSKEDIDSEKTLPSTGIESPKPSSFVKDTKQNIKNFFRHEPSEQKQHDKVVDSIDISSENEKNAHSSIPESPKDTKQNIRAFFSTFKHESEEQKSKTTTAEKSISQPNIRLENEQNIQSCTPESSKEIKGTSSVKDNIKSFFDTFKHEPGDIKHKHIACKKSSSHPDFTQESKETDLDIVASPDKIKHKESFAKSAKQNVKTFIDSFKHEHNPSKIEETQKKTDGNEVLVKDSEKIDKLDEKHKKSTPKQEETTDISIACKKSSSHPDFTQESSETDLDIVASSEKTKHKESFAKSAKQNVKTFFDSFKHEHNTSKIEETQKKTDGIEILVQDPEEIDKHDEKHKKSISQKQDTKQSIKTFFDNFKMGDLNAEQNKITSIKTVSEPDLHKEPTTEASTTSKDKKHNIKTFFDSFKLGDSSAELKNKELKGQISLEPELKKESVDRTATPQKESKHPGKKLFSFNYSKEKDESSTHATLDSSLLKKSEKDKPAKVVKSVKLDLNPKYSNGTENVSASFSQMNGDDKEVICEVKERAQSVPVDPYKSKNIFTLLERKTEACTSSSNSHGEQFVEPKESQQSTNISLESSDKTNQENSSLQSKNMKSMNVQNAAELSKNEESKLVDKSTKEKKNKSIRRSLSDKLNREEVVQNFKGFFDSLGHKSSSKKSAKESEHIYDVVEVKHEVDSPFPTINISSEVQATKIGVVKCETQGMKKNLKPIRPKDVSKPGSDNIYISESKLEKKENLPRAISSPKSCDLSKNVASSSTGAENSSPIVNEPSSPKSDKNVFNAIGENILALKEKMLHPKEKRKSELIEDLAEESHKTSQVNEPCKENLQEVVMSVTDKQHKENIEDLKPISYDKPVQAKDLPKPQASLPVTKDNVTKEESTSHPNSLYDTCCVKLAFLLRDKALEVVSEHTKSPPPKPPKPSAEAIAKAQAAAIARKIEAQKRNKSFGENFSISYDGMRFADDETESSCDYKDVENFDYIMDYELINRYKIDSSKLDTFSVPSTCSGLTSYYTADSAMETISLSSDISYNYKQLPFSSKTSAAEENKRHMYTPSTKSALGSKQPTTKKVPPPIPPKPIILQSISKIKEKPDDKAVSQCVNGLSLSPRLENKFSKDPAVTQKRPLLVADIKGTQFSSLQHPKKPPKPTRNFNTVLRNESLKKVPCVSSDNMSILTDKNSEKDLSLQYSSKIEKRTKSPPRPPPPNIAKKLPKPERPPPPIKSVKSPISEDVTEKKSNKDDKNQNTDITGELNEMQKVPGLNEFHLNIESDSKGATLSDKNESLQLTSCRKEFDNEKSLVIETRPDDVNKSDFQTLQDDLNNNYETEKDVTILTEKPKPPPRNRRIRSRTVEIVPIEKQEERLKRSSSLSEIDVQKRVTFLEEEKAKFDSKSLYTKVNKNGKKLNYEKTSQSSPDLVSGRPLPPPPPPPRRFRSLERKSKSKKTIDEKMSEQAISVSEPVTSVDVKPPARRKKTDKERFLSLHTDLKKEISSSSENLKGAESAPLKPERRLKSLSPTKYDVNANISSAVQSQNSSNQSIPDTADSVSNPKHKKEESRKRSHSSWYDENESFRESWEVVDDLSLHELGEENKESPKVPVRRKTDTKRKGKETSKFYINMEEADPLTFNEETSSLPLVDKAESPLPPLSKAGSSSILVDKETSPLPLDCSEKSVQTSLETLSQGIVSHDDDQSEDTDELLDLAQTLQKELSSIISRHKSVNENIEDTPSPPLSAATSEKNLTDFKDIKKTSSVRSSTSEVWPVTSSDESDVERVGEDSSNISEVSVKRKQKKIFYIAQEIMTSEEAFVDALKLLNVDFKAAVEAANKQRNMCVIPDEVLSQILNHLPQLQHLNENLLMELKDRIENWDKHEKIADIIVKMGPFLKLYSWYIHDFESNVSLLEDCKKKYPAFSQTVKEFEMSARCKKLTLNHFMLKPIQRIPQYRLLLQEYVHQLTEDSKDYQDTLAALQIVSDVANHANNSMKHGDNAQKLISIQNSIVGHKEIVKPGRVFIKEGELMKLSRKGMQPRWFVLFNDLLLYLTPVQQGLYRVNHELPLTGMKVAIPIQQDYQNEFSIISVTRSFTLAARSQEERQEWIVSLTKAIEENASKRSTFTNSRLHQKAQDKTSSEDEGAFVLGRKAPVWIPDARVTMCQLCTSEFTVTFRRHHCRACGKVICSICSSHRISLPYLGNRIARVCDECHSRLGQGSSACTESGETDSDNQQIAVKPHLRTDNRHLKKNKKSLPSVLKEVCANDQGSTISGYLHKKTGKSWKRDWFVVKDKVLYEYKASEDVAALKSTPLLGYEIESFSEGYEGIDASLLFQLTHPGQAPFIFYADTVGSTERWVSALKTAIVLE